MNRKIQTYDDLLAEKARLQELLDAQKELLKLDVQDIKSSFKPATNVLSMIGDMKKKSVTNPLLGIAVSLSTDILLRKLLFKRAGWALKTILPFVMKKVTKQIVSNPPKAGLFGRLLRKAT
jgi:hypothetical protein